MPVYTDNKNTGMLSGISLRNVEIELMVGGKVLAKQAGDIMFTHKGITGPAIFEIGGTIFNFWMNNKEKKYPVLKIDFIPYKNKSSITDLYMEFKNKNPKKEIISFMRHLLPDIPLRLAKHIMNCSGIGPDYKISNIPKDDVNKLIDNLKGFLLNVTGLPSPDKALVTEGGIQIKEINPKKMESLVQNGLYFAGEVIEIAGPEGGYNLQKAFSTGWLAGLSACDDYINDSLKK
jgi:predicted Rossmann fold flavoprotein